MPNLGIRLNLEPAITQVAFTPKGIDRGGIVRSDFFLFRIVAHAHANVVVAGATADDEAVGGEERIETYHHMLNGSSKRVIRMPLSSLRARSPSACLPVEGVNTRA